MQGFAVRATNANVVICNSHYGEIFFSEDTGDSCHKMIREFSEIRALAWTPN